jgi:hypothetical protein
MQCHQQRATAAHKPISLLLFSRSRTKALQKSFNVCFSLFFFEGDFVFFLPSLSTVWHTQHAAQIRNAFDAGRGLYTAVPLLVFLGAPYLAFGFHCTLRREEDNHINIKRR